MFYYWVEMHYACPRGHGNLANRYYKADSVEQAKSAALASDLTCSECPAGSFIDVSKLAIQINTYPFDDETEFEAHAPAGAVPQILPLKTQ